MSLQYQLINGNSAEELKKFPDNHFDSVVTDPPYGINFLGKDWDTNTGEEEVYRQCLRVLKPGGHLIAFSAARTYHHLAMAVERSGFEIRDQIMWVYGSGFPKSQDIGRQIDKAAGKKGIKGPLKRGAERMINATDVSGNRDNTDGVWANEVNREPHIILPESDAAKQWSGWGTNLKPAHEPCVLAQKPFKDAIYKNVQKWGVGAINVDACRVEYGANENIDLAPRKAGVGVKKLATSFSYGVESTQEELKQDGFMAAASPLGRFPANFIHDGSTEVVQHMPDNSQRFFYSAKVSRAERHIGHEEEISKHGRLSPKSMFGSSQEDGDNLDGNDTRVNMRNNNPDKKPLGINNHPTVKPVALMKYLVTLITPPGGKVLDPFNGSGSTGMACAELGMDYTGIDLDPNYIAISERRIEAWYAKTHPQTPNPFGNDLFQEEEEK
jgi:site-specific DNA-methyltransferase (adenine-specific)